MTVPMETRNDSQLSTAPGPQGGLHRTHSEQETVLDYDDYGRPLRPWLWLEDDH